MNGKKSCPSCGTAGHLFVSAERSRTLYRCLRCQHEWVEEKPWDCEPSWNHAKNMSHVQVFP